MSKLFAAAASEPEANERGSSLIGKRSLYRACNHFSYQAQGIVVGGNIKDARNCSCVRIEDSRCAVEFNVILVDDPRANAASLICFGTDQAQGRISDK